MRTIDEDIIQDHMDQLTYHVLCAVVSQLLGEPLVVRLRAWEAARRCRRNYTKWMEPILKKGTTK